MEEIGKRFLEGLKNYNLTADEVKDWWYCGGGHTTQIERHRILADLFRSHFPDSDYPELEENCVCGHPIQENAFITNGEQLLVLGSCCVKRFTNSGTKRVCKNCKQPWKGDPKRFCKKCRYNVISVTDFTKMFFQSGK